MEFPRSSPESLSDGGSDSVCVWQASWTLRGWALVFSMETPPWGSCDSREAPPHRTNSSAAARVGLPRSGTTRDSQDAPYRSVLGSSLGADTGCGGHAPCLICLPTSLLQVLFGVCNSSLPQSHTHLGPPRIVVAEIFTLSSGVGNPMVPSRW